MGLQGGDGGAGGFPPPMIGVPPNPPPVPPVPPLPPEPELGAGVLGGGEGAPPSKTVHRPSDDEPAGQQPELSRRMGLPNAPCAGRGALSGVCEQREIMGAAIAIGTALAERGAELSVGNAFEALEHALRKSETRTAEQARSRGNRE